MHPSRAHLQAAVPGPTIGRTWHLLAGAALLACAPAARAATLAVDRTDDVTPIPSVCSVAPNDCTLRGAISKKLKVLAILGAVDELGVFRKETTTLTLKRGKS